MINIIYCNIFVVVVGKRFKRAHGTWHAYSDRFAANNIIQCIQCNKAAYAFHVYSYAEWPKVENRLFLNFVIFSCRVCCVLRIAMVQL